MTRAERIQAKRKEEMNKAARKVAAQKMLSQKELKRNRIGTANLKHHKFAGGLNYTRRPMTWLRHKFNRQCPDMDPEARSHIQKWMRDIMARVEDDPRQQAVAQVAVLAYSQVVQLEVLLLKEKPDSEKAERLGRLLVLWSERLNKSIRMAGLRAHGTINRSAKRNTVFSAVPSGSSLRDEDESESEFDEDEGAA